MRPPETTSSSWTNGPIILIGAILYALIVSLL